MGVMLMFLSSSRMTWFGIDYRMTDIGYDYSFRWFNEPANFIYLFVNNDILSGF